MQTQLLNHNNRPQQLRPAHGLCWGYMGQKSIFFVSSFLLPRAVLGNEAEIHISLLSEKVDQRVDGEPWIPTKRPDGQIRRVELIPLYEVLNMS